MFIWRRRPGWSWVICVRSLVVTLYTLPTAIWPILSRLGYAHVSCRRYDSVLLLMGWRTTNTRFIAHLYEVKCVLSVWRPMYGPTDVRLLVTVLHYQLLLFVFKNEPWRRIMWRHFLYMELRQQSQLTSLSVSVLSALYLSIDVFVFIPITYSRLSFSVSLSLCI